MSSSHGFTLLEMLVVIIVLSLAGTIVALAVPHANNRVALAEAEARIVKVLTDAHAQARRAAASRRVIFDLDRRQLQVEGSHDRSAIPWGVELSIVSAREVGSSRHPAILFLGDGTNSGADITLMIDRHTSRLHVDWLSGRIGHESF